MNHEIHEPQEKRDIELNGPFVCFVYFVVRSLV